MTVTKGILYLFALFVWLFLGGFFTLGPYIAHNIDKTVGTFALHSPTVAWLFLPITGLMALAYPYRFPVGLFTANLVLWLTFLGYLYATWTRA